VQTTSQTQGSVGSADGTTIGYRQLGHGPGIIVVHGSMSSGYYHVQLAEALAGTFSVWLPDRRGRGLSGPYRPGDGLQQEADDLDALLAATGARNVFAVSVGANIALHAATRSDTISKLALNEPLLFPDRAVGETVMAQFSRQLDAGKTAAALATAMKGAQLGPPLLNAMPHWLLAAMTSGMANWTPPGEYLSPASLAPALRYEGQEITEMSGGLASIGDVRAEVLLLGGSKSSPLIKNALRRVQHAVPHAQRVELPGLKHSASWNQEVRGNPGAIAAALIQFFEAGASGNGA
jgi:pimeloyl-ACP methyl ester carboxylesterase